MSSQKKGREFEKLFEIVAPHIEDLEIESVSRWSDWVQQEKNKFDSFFYDGKDCGIDLVAYLKTGERVAIQCKYYESTAIGKSQVQNFLAAINEGIFDLYWFVTLSRTEKQKSLEMRDQQGEYITGNKNNFTPDAFKLFKNKNNLRLIDFNQYGNHVIQKYVKPKIREPWKLQKEAINSVVAGFQDTDASRGRLIMPCGTGKTFCALRIAEEIALPFIDKPTNILFIAPSIALVAQIRREWLNHTQRDLNCIVICSDKTAGKTVKEGMTVMELPCPVTTDPVEIESLLNRKIPPDSARVVFCTYQSLDKLLEAQQDLNRTIRESKDKHVFDIAIIDEAHRTTGIISGESSNLFQLIHDGKKIQARKRLYMTATPRVYKNKVRKDSDIEIVDMNDNEIYGREFYRLSFKKAVENNMLCDYRVIALSVPENLIGTEFLRRLIHLNEETSASVQGMAGKAADDQAALGLLAIALGINGLVDGSNAPDVIERTIAYASNIRRSKWLAS